MDYSWIKNHDLAQDLIWIFEMVLCLARQSIQMNELANFVSNGDLKVDAFIEIWNI